MKNSYINTANADLEKKLINKSLMKFQQINVKTNLNFKIIGLIVFFLNVSQSFGQTTYTWVGASGGSWTTAANWSPSRTPAATDILQFTSGTVTVTNVQNQTIGKLLVTGGAAVTLNRSANITLTIAGGTGTDLVVDAGCQLNVGQTTANNLSLSLSAGATGSISGSMTFSSTTASAVNQLLAADANAVTFNSGSVFTQSTNSTGSAFGTSGTAGTIVFASGATFISASGANPFGLTAPNSKVNFQTGSNYKHTQNTAPVLNNRTYPNFEWAITGSQSPTGATAVTIDNLTITSGTLNINLTGGANIKGNVSVASGSTLTFSNTPNFNGSLNSQTISNDDTLSFNANVVIANTATIPSVTFNNAQAISGTTITVNAGSTFLNNGTLNLSATLTGNGTINNNATGTITVPTATINTGSTLTNNGIMNISNNLQSGGSFVNDITGTLNYGGTIAPTVTTFTTTANGNTVNYNAADAQPIRDVAYSNLTISGGNTKTWNNFSDRTFKNLTIASGTNFIINQGNNFDRTFIVNDNLFNNGTLTINPFSGRTATLQLNNTVTSKVNNGSITVPNITIGFNVDFTNNGTLNVDTSLTGSGIANTFINSATGTFNYGGVAIGSSVITLTTSAAGNTVNYNGTDQTIKTNTYSNLIFSGSGIKTIDTGTTTVNNNLTNNVSVDVSILSGRTLTVANSITNNGTLTIENDANLIQTSTTNTNTGSGTATVKRNSNLLSRLDYTLWSSPTGTTQSLYSFSPLTLSTRFYEYNPVTNLYNDISSTTPFSAAKGFLIRMPNNAVVFPATQLFNGVFTGVVNNGDYSVSAAAGQFVAVGNPYPSNINATSFLAGNTSAGSTLYFWRKLNNINQGTSPTSSYATWTTAGGVANGGYTPNGIISVGQGFLVNTGTGTSINFTNSMRASTTATFLRTNNSQPDRIWLNLTNPEGGFSQMLVAYMVDATLGVDTGIDGLYINDAPTALTSLIAGSEYIIQGRPTFTPIDIVPLSFKTSTAGNFTISIDHIDGLFALGQSIYLEDTLTNTLTDLQTSSYTFSSQPGTYNTRFLLKYQSSLNSNEVPFNENNVAVTVSNGDLNIISSQIDINSIKIYDIQGRLIIEKNNINKNSATIKDLKVINQVLIVKVTGVDKSVFTKKVLN